MLRKMQSHLDGLQCDFPTEGTMSGSAKTAERISHQSFISFVNIQLYQAFWLMESKFHFHNSYTVETFHQIMKNHDTSLCSHMTICVLYTWKWCKPIHTKCGLTFKMQIVLPNNNPLYQHNLCTKMWPILNE